MAEHIERMGRRIRERREELDLSQGELARLLSGTPDAAQVSRWENGRHEPGPDRKQDIATALKTTVADLMAGPVSERQDQETTPDLVGTLNGMPEDVRELLAKIDGKLDDVLAVIGPDENGETLADWLRRRERAQAEADRDEPQTGEAEPG